MFLLLKELLALVIICEIVSAVDDSSLDYVKLITSELAKAMAYKERVNNEDLYPKSASGDIKDFGDFEFIVVGAGTAGSLVANKLAGRKLKTLLIEAGGDETKFTDIPAMFRQLQFSDKNWGYYTTPQEHACQGMINKQCAFPRGKVMGGTSTIGGLTYARGSQVDQDLWSEYDIGNWSWRSVLPYYIDLENYSPIGLDQLGDGTSFHGFKGSMPIDFARPANSLENIFLAANEQVYDVTKDINGPSYMAAGKVQFMKKNGRRISSAKAFLKSFNSKFLTITKLSYAYKILLNNYRMAEGVLFMKDGQRYRARASHEVILSGGSINTPHLLMLSGIGPKAELAMHGIPLVKDLPVGKNLVGHVGFHGLQFESKLKLYDRNKKFAEQISEYQAGTGALANVAIDGMAYVSTTKDKDNPDLEVFISSRGALNVTANNEWHFTEDTLAEFSPPNEALEYVFRIAILVIKAHSKGEVTLKSADPTAFPNINTNSLSDPRDIKTIYKGIKYILKLLESDAFKNINANLLKRVLPDCRQHEYLSQEYWTCMIRHVSGTANHPVGTCRIGEGKEGVVDTNLRVKGVGSLRVIDLSVAPRVNSLHTNALALAIGSKGADFVIESYRMKDDNEL